MVEYFRAAAGNLGCLWVLTYLLNISWIIIDSSGVFHTSFSSFGYEYMRYCVVFILC